MSLASLVIWNILEISAIFFMFIAIISLYNVRKKFLSTEIKKITKWIVIISIIVFLIQTINFTFQTIILLPPGDMYILRAIFVFLISLYFIKIAYEMSRFSNIFGFAKPEKKFARAFIKSVKKKGGKKRRR